MRTVTLTCVACGNSIVVQNSPEQIRNRYCFCKASMVERRQPGSIL